MLTFDADACIRALVERLIKVSDSLMNEFYMDATAPLSAEGKKDSEREDAKYDSAKHIIESKCIFYVQAILESFGVGWNADRSPESYWNEYTQMTPTFNRARTSGTIVGRPKGNYRDIWGEERYSEGKNEGKNLQTLHLLDTRTGNYHQVWPSNQEPWTTNPTHSIKNAEAWIHRDTETKVERRIEMEVTRFLSEEAGKFFIEVGD